MNSVYKRILQYAKSFGIKPKTTYTSFSAKQDAPVSKTAAPLAMERREHLRKVLDGFKRSHTSIAKDLDYKIVYRFKYIAPVRMLCRLKLYQTCFLALATPACFIMYYTGSATLENVKNVGLMATLALFILFAMSEYFRRLVGLIYVNKAGDVLRVAHLTFWGNRKDIYFPVTDLVPISDTEEKPGDILVKISRYSVNNYLYMSIRHGIIYDEKLFESVFGNVVEKKRQKK